MAEINISNLGGGGGGTLTLTTTGTGGASTYVAGVLNIPVYQSALTNPVTGTGTATRVAFWDSASSVSSSANLYWDNSNSFLGVGTATPGARLQINGAGATSGTSSLLINNSGASELFRVSDNGLISVGKNVSVSTQSSSQIAATSGDANTNIVITPKGSGAFIIGPAPDGTTTGGNSRGIYAIDFQSIRSSSADVASGQRALVMGGESNRATGAYSTTFGGYQNRADNYSSIAGGWTCNATGDRSFSVGAANLSSGQYSAALNSNSTASGVASLAVGSSSTASATGSFASGVSSLANLYASWACASGQFSAQGDAQTLEWRYRRSIAGTGIQELTLDGAAPSTQGRATLVANRLWNVNLQVSAICSTVGNGTLTLGDSYVATYQVGIKRLVNTTTLVGTPQLISTQSDTGMSTSAVTISADDTNECLKIEFTPPTGGAAGSTTVIRVVVTATATVAGY
jgi:hypothetical protein